MPLPDTTPSPQSDWRLADWLAWQERLNLRTIELGLERTREVARRLALLPAAAVTLTVAGTNGKGSSAVLAATIYGASGYRSGCYTSPHLLRYNERIAIDGEPVADERLCAAFAAVERARLDIPLTYFEFGTLAALYLFREAAVEVQVLEVGLGGRLDAVNVIDADCALLTNVGLDHMDWLGPDRESIGREKAGVFRAGRPAVCVDPDPPDSVSAASDRLGADLRRLGMDFDYAVAADGWSWRGREDRYPKLPFPALSGAMQVRNAAGVLAAVEALQPVRPVAEQAIEKALTGLRLPGRLQRCGDLLLDVGHNAEAIRELAGFLRAQTERTRVLVIGMLSDKPVEAVGRILAPLFETVVTVDLPLPRGLNAATLRCRLAAAGISALPGGAMENALSVARSRNRAPAPIVVCGSFLTVAAALSSHDHSHE